jgi:peptidoglycan-associated lipoprotein
MMTERNAYKIGQLAVVGAVLLLVLGSLLTGCGGQDQDVETDPTEAGVEAPAEDLDRPVVPEGAGDIEQEAAPLRDYSLEAPQDYGVEDVFFAFDSSELSAEAMSTLARNARILREVGTAVIIEGHCDERGTVEYNLALGERRGQSVRDYLVSLGVAASQLEVVSYGESRPFAPGHDEGAWALNRRAHFARR